MRKRTHLKVCCPGDGGGILSRDVQLRLDAVTVKDCAARSGDRQTIGLGGGALIEGGSVVLNDMVLSENSARVGGAAMLSTNPIDGGVAEVVAYNSTLTRNAASLMGGAVYVDEGSSATFVRSVVRWNVAASSGGAFALDGGAVLCGTRLFNDT